ncbi:TrkH family potassium uptake protein [Pseudoruegeria sp. SK021]|uniref:TrkH family potassium uptake protein n=1 Tax=Pseudoruegeria sp. SK021 TaxID=1933035 RepID=UPI000A2245CC|nr:TrkH family potassium uptake protein [Pseudoruegeria sp. SK021]OSP56678.1 potassium transporter TrkH [Pseudoruegeria sp. SK021]
MIDFRPVGYVVGLLVAILGGTMLIPMMVDLAVGNDNWFAMLESAVICITLGMALAGGCLNGAGEKLTLQQVFLLTTAVWLALPTFGALPFVLGAPNARFVDAFFEAMSGFTTTGSTVFVGLEELPHGTLLWRGMLQWFGGVGIIVVAMVFLPELGVGGMQLFKSEGFETDGKILPRARQIASQVSVIYVVLTVACGLIYALLGMSGFDAIVHSMTTISTGGMANYDSSFGGFSAGEHYCASIFMILSALPFVRYVQFMFGSPRSLWRDTQVRTFLIIVTVITLAITFWEWRREGFDELQFREALFNTTSIITGTGYSSADYQLWGTFPVVVLFLTGLVGGCAGSTACSVKVFRYQILFASLKAQVRGIHSPSGIFVPRYDGRPIPDAVLSSVMFFFTTFILSLGVLSVLLGMTGLDFATSLSGAATAMANIGPGLGKEIGPSGNFAGLNDTAKWLLAIAMMVGRLELLAVLTLLTPQFWRV